MWLLRYMEWEGGRVRIRLCEPFFLFLGNGGQHTADRPRKSHRSTFLIFNSVMQCILLGDLINFRTMEDEELKIPLHRGRQCLLDVAALCHSIPDPGSILHT